MKWIEIDPNEDSVIPQEDVWVYTIDTKEVKFIPKGEFIPFGYCSHYIIVEKPNPPIKMNKQKLVHELFVGKVSEIIGFEKAAQLLKDSIEGINEIDKDYKTCDCLSSCKKIDSALIRCKIK